MSETIKPIKSKKYLDRGLTSWHTVCVLINTRIKTLLRARGWKIVDMAKVMARQNPDKKVPSQSQLSRMLAGKRQWLMAHLELVAKVLGVQVGDLADERVAIPIVAEISATHYCRYPDKIDESQILGYLPLPRIIAEKEGWPMAEAELYGIRISDSSYEPVLFKGTELIIHRNGDKKEGDLIIYCDEAHAMHLGRLFFHDDNVLLRSLNPGAQKDILLPRRLLGSMDRVIAQLFI